MRFISKGIFTDKLIIRDIRDNLFLCTVNFNTCAAPLFRRGNAGASYR